eukprot:gene36865-45477_t
MQTEEVDYLQSLAGSSLLSIVPSGDYDDAYILNYARDNNGFVVSNDFFNDHINQIENPQVRNSMRLWLGENRSGYTFVNHKEFLPNPGSKMSVAISNRSIERHLNQSSAAQSTTQTTDSGADHRAALQSIVQSLSAAADGLYGLQRGDELKHVLLARARLLIELNLLPSASSDLTFILHSLDSQCVETRMLMERVAGTMN